MRVFCTSSHCDLEGDVSDDADLDGQFELLCADTGERLLVNGWLFNVEKVDEPVA